MVNMAGSLVAQLCYQSGIFPDELERAFHQSHNTPGSQRPNLPLLRRTMEALALHFEILLLIDALDECQQRQDALEFFSDLQKTMPNARILVTSRDEVDIRTELHSFTQMRIEGHLSEVNQDVEAYINHRLSSDRKLQWLNASVRSDIASLLIEKSAGM